MSKPKRFMIVKASNQLDEKDDRVIYAGKPVELKDFKDHIDTNTEEARKYFYTFIHLIKSKQKIHAEERLYNYGDIIEGKEVSGKSYYFQGAIDIPIN